MCRAAPRASSTLRYAVSQAIGLLGVLVWLLLSGDPFPGVVELLPATVAGVAGLVGLAALYRGMAIGAMGIVAPISAAGPVVPLVFDAVQGVIPSALQWLGVALVISGIVVLSRDSDGESGDAGVAAGVGLALVAALAFGIFFVGIDAAADESVPWAIVAVRSASVMAALVAVALTRSSLRAPGDLLVLLVAVGIFDTGANVAVAAATTSGAVGVVAVLSALYPVVTVLLARVFLHERLSRSRRLGGVVALGGAALVAAG